MAAPSFDPNSYPEPTAVFEIYPDEKLDETSHGTDTPNPHLLTVKDYEIEKALVSKAGYVITSLRAEMSNDSVYKVKITEAAEPQQVFERMVAKSSAWFTDENDPYNVNWSELLAEKGMTVIDTSHEHILRRNLGKAAKRFVKSSLLNDTHAQLAALQMIRDEKLAGEVSDEVISTGLSKSSITSSLMVGRAADYDLKIPFVDGIDSSGEHRWKIGELPSLKRLGAGALTETAELVKIAGDYAPNEFVDVIAHHLFMSPQSLAGHLAATKSLVLSEAGRDFITPPPESIMHLTCFSNCWFNQHDGWIRRLAELKNVHVDVLPGGHLRGGSKDIRQRSAGRILKVQNLLESGLSPQGIDPLTQTPRLKIAA
jgi:hypothetical protein